MFNFLKMCLVSACADALATLGAKPSAPTVITPGNENFMPN